MNRCFCIAVLLSRCGIRAIVCARLGSFMYWRASPPGTHFFSGRGPPGSGGVVNFAVGLLRLRRPGFAQFAEAAALCNESVCARIQRPAVFAAHAGGGVKED